MAGGGMFCQFQGIACHIGKLIDCLLLIVMAENQKFVSQFLLPDSYTFNQDVFCLFVNFGTYFSLLQTHFFTASSTLQSNRAAEPVCSVFIFILYFYFANFTQVAHGPFPDTLKLWDKLLSKGKPVVAVGGSDAHKMKGSLGPINRDLFPYEQHFQAVNTHLLLAEPLQGSVEPDCSTLPLV